MQRFIVFAVLALSGFLGAAARADEADSFLLEISAADAGIEVRVDGKAVGFTPYSGKLPRADFKLELVHPDWEPFSLEVAAPVGKKLSLRPQLVPSRSYRLRTLKAVRERLSAELESMRRVKESWDTVGTVSLCTIGGGVAVGATGMVGAAVAEPQYQAAGNAADASRLHSEIQAWNTVFNVGLIAASAGLATGVVTLICTPDIQVQQLQIDSIDHQIERLEPTR